MLQPLGEFNTVLPMLEEYEVDEIHLINLTRHECSKFNITSTLSEIAKVPLMTPLGIGGFEKLGFIEINRFNFFERHLLNSALFSPSLLSKYNRQFGRQALVAYLPFKYERGTLLFFNSSINKFMIMQPDLLTEISNSVSDIVLMDSQFEGKGSGFQFSVLTNLNFSTGRVIISGGIGPCEVLRAKELGLAGVTIDNMVLFKENSLKSFFK